MVSEALISAARRFRQAEDELTAAREVLATEILAELGRGAKQADVARATGYAREHIRRITRSADTDQAR